MKPCAKYKKSIAWLALDALTAQQARELRAHVQICDACRGYLDEITRVTTHLRLAEPANEPQISEAFQARLSHPLCQRCSRSRGDTLRRPFPRNAVYWRIAWPALAAVAVALVAGFIWLRLPRFYAPPTSLSRGLTPKELRGDPSPSLGNYRMVADRSLEQLDALLTRQANRALPPSPVYSVSLFSL